MRQTKSSVAFHYQPRLNGYVAVFTEPRESDSVAERGPILLRSQTATEGTLEIARKLRVEPSCESVASVEPATKNSTLAFIDMK